MTSQPKVLLADGEYFLQKQLARARGLPHTISIQIIEKRFGLKPGQLAAYRANNYSRKK
jgi:hypothetical protein